MNGKQTFNVPNDSEGREFLRLLKKFKAPGHSYRARGRGPRKAPGDNYVNFSRKMNLPHADAESFAVYMGKKTDTTFIADSQLDYRQQGLLIRAEREEEASQIRDTYYSEPTMILMVENEGYSFQIGEYVGISQFRKGFPLRDGKAGYIGRAVESCGPDDQIKVAIG